MKEVVATFGTEEEADDFAQEYVRLHAPRIADVYANGNVFSVVDCGSAERLLEKVGCDGNDPDARTRFAYAGVPDIDDLSRRLAAFRYTETEELGRFEDREKALAHAIACWAGDGDEVFTQKHPVDGVYVVFRVVKGKLPDKIAS